jgi:hypothetical protein
MSVVIPRVIRPAAKEIKEQVKLLYPNVLTVDDMDGRLQDKWYEQCGEHENFYTDATRYIGDLVAEMNANQKW